VAGVSVAAPCAPAAAPAFPSALLLAGRLGGVRFGRRLPRQAEAAEQCCCGGYRPLVMQYVNQINIREHCLRLCRL